MSIEQVRELHDLWKSTDSLQVLTKAACQIAQHTPDLLDLYDAAEPLTRHVGDHGTFAVSWQQLHDLRDVVARLSGESTEAAS